LGTVFLSRMLALLAHGGTVATALLQNSLFLVNYADLRGRLLRLFRWDLLARLGPGAFETISGEVVNVMLLGLTNARPPAEHRFSAVDATEAEGPQCKAGQLRSASPVRVEQASQLENPDARVLLDRTRSTSLLSTCAAAYQGLVTGDDPRRRRQFWEVRLPDGPWRPLQSTVRGCVHHGGRSGVVDWTLDGATLARRQGTKAWGRTGVAVTQMSTLPATLYSGEVFDVNGAAVIPHEEAHLPALWCFLCSPDYRTAVRRIDQSLKVTNATLVKVPFDLPHWQQVAAERYPDGLPEPYSEDPTQWIFRGTVVPSTAPLQVAVARLVGYRWPEQSDDGLADLADEDGIVCIPPVRGEATAADRLRSMLVRAYGDRWSADREEALLRRSGCARRTLDWWLRNKFFDQHCALFHQRPFVWHIWDGHKDGFSALVLYHKLDRRLPESLVYSYVGDWLTRQEGEAARNVAGAADRKDAARGLQRRLKLVLEGDVPHDVFVRWKPIEQQPIGWDPDLDDGVRLNIRPFVTAGVLRKNPRVSWKKDRGKDPEDAPWYDLGPSYGGKASDRINDHHLTLADKRAARVARAEGG